MFLKMERISWLQGSRVQVSSSPESKRLGVQSPSVQLSRVSKSPVALSPRGEAARPYAQSPAFMECLFKHCHSNLKGIYYINVF